MARESLTPAKNQHSNFVYETNSHKYFLLQIQIVRKQHRECYKCNLKVHDLSSFYYHMEQSMCGDDLNQIGCKCTLTITG